jgi:hypothetical protein
VEKIENGGQKMKKIVIGLAIVAVLGIGGGLVYSQIGTNGVSTETTNTETAAGTQTTNQVQQPAVKAPTARTVDTKNDYPWKYFSSSAIIQQQKSGQIVFLMSDAQALEDEISSFSQQEFKELEDKSKNTAGLSKDKMADSWAGYLNAFIQGTEIYYPDKVDYFSKMGEVKAALESHNFEAIPNLISAAKQLRK